jgi:hypothetical protein
MATQASIEAVQKMYIAYYGRPADQSGLTAWADALDAANGDMSAIVEAFGTSAEATARFGGQSSAETITTLYQQMFGRDPESTDILNAWVDQLENNPAVTLQSIALDLLSGAQNDDAAAINNKLTIAQAFTAAMDTTEEQTAYAGDAAITAGTALLDTVTAATDTTTVDVDAVLATLVAVNPNPGTGTGTEFTLTSGTDRGTDFEGTADNDTYTAYLSQNALVGGVSNTLSSADMLNGNGGTDSLHAELVPEFFGVNGSNQIDVQARTSSIENVSFEARDIAMDQAASASQVITVDAKKMTDIEKIGSSFSDGDLVIENLTTLTNAGIARSTDVITVTMDHTDNFNSDNDASDLTVYFDEDYLLPTTNLGESSVVFKIMNQDSYDQNDGEMRLDGVYVARMEFSLNGTNYDLAPFIEENAQGLGDEFKTEAELVAYLNATALPALAAANPSAAAALNSLAFTIGAKWNDNNQNRIGDEIVLTASNAHTLETRDAWLTIDQAESVPDSYASNRIERTGVQVGNDSTELSVGVELHKVGREGEGGDLIIGGKELDQDAGRDNEGNGIDIFNISVLGADNKPSNLGAISSTNDALDVVNITTGAAYVNGTSFASLTIRDGFGITGGVATPEVLTAVNANSFLGDLTIGSDVDVLNLATLNAAGGGDVKFYGTVNADGNYDYNTGAGADTIDLDIDTDATDRVETSLNVNTASGDDTIALNTASNGDASQQTMALFSNMDVLTGAGNDTVVVTGDGRFNIDAGSNDDFVYINSQLDATAGTVGTWAFGRTSDSLAVDFADQVLYQATLTVTFAGLESQILVPTDSNGNFVANQLIINAAIEEAINQSPELSKLLTVARGDGDQLMTVTSTVDGENDLAVSIAQPNVVATGAGAGEVAVSTGDVLELVEGLMQTNVAGIDSNSDASAIGTVLNAATVVVETANNGGSSDATGATNVNFSVVDMGSGNNDLLVMDSNEDSSNVLVVDQTFGKVTVVNFHDNAPLSAGGAVVGQHAIDFTHYLNNTVDASNNGNSLSETALAVTLNANANGANFAANSVNMIVNLVEDTANGQTFATLTADTLLGALNGVAGSAFANISASNPTTTTDLVGSTQNHVVMVENPNNAGEYKVFHLTSSNTGTDFASAVQLGTMDFGDSINFNLVGSTDYTADIANLINLADGGTGVIVDPTATFALTADAAAADEGTTATFSLTTTNVADGTAVAYTLTGVDAADVTGGQLTGSATVTGGVATISVALAADATTEATAETLTVTIDGQSASASTTVTDSSQDGATVVTTVDLSTVSGVQDAATGDFIFSAAQGNNTAITINGFAEGDALNFAGQSEGDFNVNNSDFTDGQMEIVVGDVTITLTGLTNAQDLVNDAASFQAVYTADPLTFV